VTAKTVQEIYFEQKKTGQTAQKGNYTPFNVDGYDEEGGVSEHPTDRR
jgi:hypothetical protein